MGFPDRIERTVDIAHRRQGVGGADDIRGLAAWFGNEASSTCAQADRRR
jgi:hypothetical protein